MTNFRWTICALLFFATTVNYLDRQVLSLTWKDFIAPEFHWTDTLYGYIGAAFTRLSTNSSVSGRGTRVAGVTLKLLRIKARSPIM